MPQTGRRSTSRNFKIETLPKHPKYCRSKICVLYIAAEEGNSPNYLGLGGIMSKGRRIRSDSTVKTAEKRLGLKDGIKNSDGSNARGDKKIGTLRKEYARKGKK
jgi:hypothetical protein